MKKLFLIIFTLIAIGGNPSVVYAGFEKEFDKATDLAVYGSGIKDMETALLIRNVTGVLHNENIKILEKLDRIEKRLFALEEMIRKLR